MNVTLLAISIGNTRTRLGTFVDGKLVQSQTVENRQPAQLQPAIDKALEPLSGTEDAIAAVASVNPPLTAPLLKLLHEKHADLKVHRVGKDLPIPIGNQLDPETITGEDRLLNAAAAYDTLKQAVVVVDAGTAITVDFVDGAGTFHGGAIGPGAQMMLDSLHHSTAQLPEVELSRPLEPIGHNSAQAMLSGVYFGLRGMVRELVEKYAEVAGFYPMIVATGGNAQLLFEDDFLIDRIVPDLTLLGIAVTVQAAVNAEEEP